jgi:hypothetical protein
MVQFPRAPNLTKDLTWKENVWVIPNYKDLDSDRKY